MREVFLLLGMSAAVFSQDMRGQDIRPEIQLVNGMYQRFQQGGADASAALQVSSQVRVVMKGMPAGNNRVSFQFLQRATARSWQEAERKLRGSASITNGAGVTLVTAQGIATTSTLEIHVPVQVKRASVEILRNGDIEVFNFPGALFATTQAGDVQAENIGGPVSIHTGGGHIRLGRVAAGVECSTGAGSITIESAGGDVNCRTAGGEILVNEVQGPVWLANGGGSIAVEHAARNVEAHSVQGGIQVEQAGGTVTADARGGEIRIGSAAGVRAESADGSVHLVGANGVLSVSAAIGSILAELMAGARLKDSSLMAASGDITVMIPSNLGLRVMATNQTGGVPRIQSDFSGVQLRMLNFDRPALADGLINGGGPTLLLSGSGMIYLRRVK